MLISYGTATVCCIYLIFKVIGVAGYLGIFPDTYRYLQAQKQQRQVLLVHMVKKKVVETDTTDRSYPHIRQNVYFYGLITRSL